MALRTITSATHEYFMDCKCRPLKNFFQAHQIRRSNQSGQGNRHTSAIDSGIHVMRPFNIPFLKTRKHSLSFIPELFSIKKCRSKKIEKKLEIVSTKSFHSQQK